MSYCRRPSHACAPVPRLAEALRREVAGTLGPDAPLADVESELRYLLRVLAHGA